MKKILIINFLVIIINNFIHPISPELLMQKHAPLLLNGFLYATMSLASFIFSPLWGKKMQQIGIKKFLMLGPLGYSIVQWGFYYFTNPLLLALSRFLAGMFASMFIVGVSSYVSIIAPKNKRTYYLGMITSTTALGAIVGQLISGSIASYSLMLPFIVLTTAAVAIVIIISLIIPDIKKEKEKQVTKNYHALIVKLKNQGNIKWLIIFIIITFCANIYNSNIGFFAKTYYDLTPQQVAYVNMIGNIVMLFMNVLVLKTIEDKFSFKVSIFVMLVCGIIGGLGILNCLNSPILIIFLIFSVLSFAIYRPIMQNYFLQHNTEDATLVSGLLNSINSLGMILGGVVSGISYSIYPQLVFIIFLILQVGGIIIFNIGKNHAKY